jgi:hypothetical protein
VHEVALGRTDDVELLRQQVRQLEKALAQRTLLDQARGVLMHRFAVDADGASARLDAWSDDTGLGLAELATTIVQLTGGDERLPPPDFRVASQVARLIREGGTAGVTSALGERSVTPAGEG